MDSAEVMQNSATALIHSAPVVSTGGSQGLVSTLQAPLILLQDKVVHGSHHPSTADTTAHVLQHQKSVDGDANIDGRAMLSYDTLHSNVVLNEENGISKSTSGASNMIKSKFNAILPTIIEVDEETSSEPSTCFSKPFNQNQVPQSLPTSLQAQQNHTLNQSAKEGNKGKIHKGREATDFPSSSKQHLTAKTNSSLHNSSGTTSAKANNNVLNISINPQQTISLSSPKENNPVVTFSPIADTPQQTNPLLDHIEHTFAFNVQQSPPPTSIPPIHVTVPENMQQIANSLPSMLKYTNNTTANRFAPLTGIFWADDDNSDHLVKDTGSSPPYQPFL
ncbi:hypothetical protein LguiB_020186 [Lonicera macranthoides]